MPEESIISVRNISFSYENSGSSGRSADILKNISLEIKKGEFVAVLGHNGSGKSTLARHFNGILTPVSGNVLVSGMDTGDEERIFDIRQKVGMVFQNPDNQIVSAVVEEDVAFGLENLGIPPYEIRSRVDEALKSVNMYEYREHSPSMLSGGQKQRIAIAGIIAMRPECIVLDEPTAMLDPAGRRDVINTIRKLNREHGITVVLITHYMDEAADADRVVVMDKGKIVLDDSPEQVFSEVEKIKSIGLDVPQAAELVYELNKCGFSLDPHIITESECAEALKKLLKED